MPDRTIRESWAIICEDGPNKGKTAVDDEENFFDRGLNRESYQRCIEGYALSGMKRSNPGCTAFRVARVRLVEMMEDSNA